MPGARHRGAEGARALHVDDGAAARARRGRRAGRRRCCSELLRETGYPDALEAERTIEAQGRLENLEELVRVAREYDATAEEGGRSASSCSRSRCSPTPTRRAGRRGPRDADDDAQRQGPRVPDRVHDRDGGRRVPALARARRGRPGGGAPARLRRAHPRDARPHAHLRPPPQRVRRRKLVRRALALHRRDPARADRPGGARGAARLPTGRVASWSSAAAATAEASAARHGGRRCSGWATTSSTPRSARAW